MATKKMSERVVVHDSYYGKIEAYRLELPEREHSFMLYHFGEGRSDRRRLLVAPGVGYGGLPTAILGQVLTDFDVWSFDPRYHGETLSLGDMMNCSWEAFGRDLVAILNELQPEIVVAHSAQPSALVLTGVSLKGLMNRLIAVDPILPAAAARAGELARYCETLPSSFESTDALWDHFQTHPFRKAAFGGFEEQLLTLYLAHNTRQVDGGRFELKLPPAVEAQIYASRLPLEHIIAGARSLDVPLLVLVSSIRRAKEDLAEQLRLATEFADNCPERHLIAQVEGRHNVLFTDPELIARQIRDFAK